MDSGCPTHPVTVVGMKIKNIGKRIVNTAKVINRFGNAWLNGAKAQRSTVGKWRARVTPHCIDPDEVVGCWQ
jgi:hypothetical protein